MHKTTWEIVQKAQKRFIVHIFVTKQIQNMAKM